jgi:hypothetical protein
MTSKRLIDRNPQGQHVPLTVAVIGGPDRMTRGFAELAALHGHRLGHHDGSLAGRGRRALRDLVARAHVVVIVTGVNSHAAVLVARDEVRRQGVPSLICRRFGLANLSHLLEVLTRQRELGTAPVLGQEAADHVAGRAAGVFSFNRLQVGA